MSYYSYHGNINKTNLKQIQEGETELALCGAINETFTVISTGQNVTLWFLTDDSINGMGFEVYHSQTMEGNFSGQDLNL